MKPYIDGQIRIQTTDNITGEMLDELSWQSNMVLDVGVEQLWRRATTEDAAGVHQLNTLYMGDDLGIGSQWGIFNPQPAQRGFTESNQNVNFVVPDTSFEFPDDESFKSIVEINGTQFMEDNFPNDIDFQFTSITLRFNNGVPFAYKRFPIRSISRFVNVRIDWLFVFKNASEFCEVE